jgi:hypothetical protein
MSGLHPSLVQEVSEVKVVPFIPIPTVRRVVVNPSSDSRRRRIRRRPESGQVTGASIGVMCHSTDDAMLEGTRNKVSTGMINRHDDRRWAEDMRS